MSEWEARDQPTLDLQAIWMALYTKNLHLVPDDVFTRAYRSVRTLTAAMDVERYRRHAPQATPPSGDTADLVAIIGDAVTSAIESGTVPSSKNIADAILAAGYRKQGDQPWTT